MENAANDADVEAAKGVAEQHLASKLGATPLVQLLSAERQVVAGGARCLSPHPHSLLG